jgi:hypothetical protein
VFAANGLNQPSSQQGMQALQQIQSQVQKLDEWATETKRMLDQYDPSLGVLLQPIAQAGMDLAKALQDKAQRGGMARGSSVVPPNAPPNPSAGPPAPAGM